ncbi:MAG: cupin domain-containing protein, partial [Pseudomonadota bacterium]|nr:cupin domain-containing protein [Pseudomonadota bacterium]
AWSKLKNISFDYDVVENIKNVRCFKYKSEWLDLGSISLFLKKSNFPNNNFRSSKIYNSRNINLYNNSLSNIIVSDLNNVDIIFHGENLLIKDSKNTDTDDLFEKINKLDIKNYYKTVTRPWGWFKTLSINDNYHVKEICVNPHKRLSLQSHKKRRESWLVIKGTATVLRDNETYILKKNDSIQIDINQKHRLENNTSKDIFLIEIQTGTYFGEDDIIRYTDINVD